MPAHGEQLLACLSGLTRQPRLFFVAGLKDVGDYPDNSARFSGYDFLVQQLFADDFRIFKLYLCRQVRSPEAVGRREPILELSAPIIQLR